MEAPNISYRSPWLQITSIFCTSVTNVHTQKLAGWFYLLYVKSWWGPLHWNETVAWINHECESWLLLLGLSEIHPEEWDSTLRETRVPFWSCWWDVFSQTFLHCAVSPPTLEFCFPAGWFPPWAESVPPCLPYETSAPSSGKGRGDSEVNKLLLWQKIKSSPRFVMVMALIDQPVPVSRGRSCPFPGRVWPNAPASAPTEAGPPERGKRETMSENLLSDQVETPPAYLHVYSNVFFCRTWSRLRVTRSFRSSALLLSSSSSISSVFILSWQRNRFT